MKKIILGRFTKLAMASKPCEMFVLRDGKIIENECGPAQVSKSGKGVTVVYSDGRTREYEIEVLPPLSLGL